MVRFKDKKPINTLLNIDNYFGEYSGKMMPMIIFFIVSAIPLFIWLFILQLMIPFKFFLVPWLLWTGRWALIILGKEKQKMKFYDKQREDEYKSANELVYLMHIYDDGLIEYSNGLVGYIISGFPKDYLDDEKLSLEFENFFTELDNYNWDLFLHNTVDEILSEDNLPKLSEYSDEDIISDRMDFYAYQDEYSRNNTKLYRYNFLVYASKYDWKKLKRFVEDLVSSEVAKCFNEVKLCTYDEVDDVFNRDICTYSDFNKMLINKYANTQFHGSKVLWYNDDIPEEYIKEGDKSSLEERRVSE